MAEKEDDRKGHEEEEFIAVEEDENGKPLNVDLPTDGDKVEDPDDDDDEDERAGHAEGEEEEDAARAGESEEERRERRRAEKKAQRIRQRRTQELKDRQISNLLQGNATLLERIARLEGRQVQYDLTNLQGRLQSVKEQIEQAKDTMAACIKAQDGEGVAEVTEIQYTLRDQQRQLEMLIARAQKAPRGGDDQDGQGDVPARRQTQGGKPTPLHPVAIRRAREWAKSHESWYDPQGTDEDSQTVMELDNEIIAEGFDPKSSDYWDELTTRVKERLPHRFLKKTAGNGNNGATKAEQSTSGKTRQPSGPRMAAASQTSGGRSLGKNEVRVTPERKKAMQEAGMWDDPVKRNRMLKQYAQYDRANQA